MFRMPFSCGSAQRCYVPSPLTIVSSLSYRCRLCRVATLIFNYCYIYKGGQAWRARRYVEGTPVRRQFFGQERTRNPSVLQIDIKPKRILFDFAAYSIPDNGQGSREFAFDPTCSGCSESSQQPNKPNYHFALILERYYFFSFIPRNERSMDEREAERKRHRHDHSKIIEKQGRARGR